MSKLRIYELAKELGLENKELLDLCKSVGVEGKKSHSNTISDDEADRLRREVIRTAVASKGQTQVKEVEREGGTFTERRLGKNVIRRRKKEELPAQRPVEQVRPPVVEEVTSETTTSSDEMTEELASTSEEFASTAESGPAELAASEAPVSEPVDQEEPLQAEHFEVPAEEPQEVEVSAAEDVQVVEVVAEAASEEPASEQVMETEAGDSAEYLEAVRKRHDIRAPRVLGKIDLPQAPEKPVAPEKKQDTDSKPQGSEGTKSRAAKPGKGKVAPGALPDEEEERGRKKRRRKQVIGKDDLIDYEFDTDGRRQRREKKHKRGEKDGDTGRAAPAESTSASKKVIKIDSEVSVGELSKHMGLKAGEVIKQLMSLGVMANINQLLDFDTVTLIADEFGFKALNVGSDVDAMVEEIKQDHDHTDEELRSPVVTVMGHVDHGKTSLLDSIRNTSVTEREAGGITQHIGAYRVNTASGGAVAFIDTPGHAAFTEMRSRGAHVTDIVVLVVAADDGVMPQTVEAINHAKAAGVPIIVAINKMDKEDANPDRVKQQLADHELIPEDWGGDTIFVPVSAHTREGIDDLLENLALQAEILELKANPNREALGTVIESRVDKGRGVVMTVLVQNGTLRKGDTFIAGGVTGRVRALVGQGGTEVTEAGPSVPVEVLGASHAPQAGEEFIVARDENVARRIVEHRQERTRMQDLAAKGGVSFGASLTLDNFSQFAGEGEKKELAIILKADVQGSVEALAQALDRLSNEEVTVRVIHKGVGAINESDVQLATASRGVIIGFNVRADSRASEQAENESIQIIYSRVIYEIVETVEKSVKGLLAPTFREKTLGRVEVRETFRVPKLGLVAGSYVLDGTISRGASVRLLRDNRVVYEGKMASLRRFKDDVKEVAAGYECGLGIEGYSDIQLGDIIEVFKVEEVQQ